jgi:type II secretory pathway pseudopilin PulG
VSFPRRRDDTGSLPMAMLLTVIGIGLSGLLAATLSAQFSAARSTAQRADAADAAQSGIEAALGRIRTANDSATGAGVYTKLPCGPFTGRVSTATTQAYTVQVYYLPAQPPAGDTTWAGNNKLPCTGTYLAAGKPLYVLLSSTGAAVSGQPGRTITATYPLYTKGRENVAGGLIKLYGVSNPELCMAAPSGTPATGAALSMQVCDAASPAQRFAYESNLNLVLAATRSDGDTGMCLDAAAHGDPVLFQPCEPATAPVKRQQWSFNDRGNFEGVHGATLNGVCFHLTAPGVAGSAVVLHATAKDPAGVSQQDAACGGDYTTSRTFTPEAEVGAGRAGPATGQLVNFDQFGRCLEVTADNVGADHLVIRPCKQKPSGAVQWSQVFTLPAITGPATSATGRITTTAADGQQYCLLSPGGTSGYVKVQLCSLAPAAATQWTRRAATGVFATAYRIESTFGAPAGVTYCLAPTDPDAVAPDLWQGASKSILQVCNDSAAQKWNAPPMILSSALTDVAEK